jgi:hypothetical protein
MRERRDPHDILRSLERAAYSCIARMRGAFAKEMIQRAMAIEAPTAGPLNEVSLPLDGRHDRCAQLRLKGAASDSARARPFCMTDMEGIEYGRFARVIKTSLDPFISR